MLYDAKRDTVLEGLPSVRQEKEITAELYIEASIGKMKEQTAGNK